jgi:hypothetical protein
MLAPPPSTQGGSESLPRLSRVLMSLITFAFCCWLRTLRAKRDSTQTASAKARSLENTTGDLVVVGDPGGKERW